MLVKKANVRDWQLCFKAMAGIAATALCGSTFAADNTVEVMHQWTSASESAAIKVLKDAATANGLVWKDNAISGDGGKTLTQALQARLAANTPPTAAAAQPQYVVQFSADGTLGDITAEAKKEQWDTLIAPQLYTYMNHDGKVSAVPFNLHRENMLWINKSVLDKFGGKAPTTWDEFLALGEKIKAAGIIPLALGGDDWQEAEIWTDIVVGQAGVDFYKKAIVGVDKQALQSPEMLKVFETYRKVLQLADPNRGGLDWAIATGKVINGTAAMQFQGDWANGEFSAANKKPGTDYVCVTAPGNGHAFVFLADFLAFFPAADATVQKNQDLLAKLVMSKDVQENFNLHAGSIPARTDVADDKFNACSKQAFADRTIGIKDGTLIPSFVENTALPADTRGQIIDVITQFANTPKMTAEEAVAKLQAGLAN